MREIDPKKLTKQELLELFYACVSGTRAFLYDVRTGKVFVFDEPIEFELDEGEDE